MVQIGTLDKEIQGVMVVLDIREETVAEAIERGGLDYRQARADLSSHQGLGSQPSTKSDLHRPHQA